MAVASRGESSSTESPNQLPRPSNRRLYDTPAISGEQEEDDDDGEGPLFECYSTDGGTKRELIQRNESIDRKKKRKQRNITNALHNKLL